MVGPVPALNEPVRQASAAAGQGNATPVTQARATTILSAAAAAVTHGRAQVAAISQVATTNTAQRTARRSPRGQRDPSAKAAGPVEGAASPYANTLADNLYNFKTGTWGDGAQT